MPTAVATIKVKCNSVHSKLLSIAGSSYLYKSLSVDCKRNTLLQQVPRFCWLGGSNMCQSLSAFFNTSNNNKQTNRLLQVSPSFQLAPATPSTRRSCTRSAPTTPATCSCFPTCASCNASGSSFAGRSPTRPPPVSLLSRLSRLSRLLS